MQTGSAKQTVSAKRPGGAKQTACAKRAGSAAVPGSPAVRGFTLLELMIVITIISILVGLAAGAYVKSVQRAKEATLKNDLIVMREAIDRYTVDKEAAPQSLEDLANPQSQYLREIPKDPITDARDWHVDFGDTVMSPDQSTTGIVDVHSNSDKVSPFSGTPYNTW